MDNSAHPNSPNEQSIQTRKPNETDSLSSNESKLTSEHETTTSSSSDETDEKQTFTRNKHSENENNGDEDVHKDKLAKGRQRKVHKRKKKSSKSKQQIESNPNPASSSDQSNEVGKGTSENKDTTTEPSKDEKDFTEAQVDSSKATATAQSPAVKPTLSIEVVQEPDTKPTLRRPSRGGGPKRLKSKTRNGRRNPLMMPKPPPVEPPPPPPAPPPAPVEPEKPTTENTEETKEVVAPLPVVKTPINICVREDWRARATKYPKNLEVEETALKLPAVGVVFITNTEVDECKSWAHCAHEVRKIQNYHMDVLGLKDIAYNWLIGGDMTVFEGLGWDRRGPAASNTEVNKFLGHDVYIGFLGQYTAETIPLNTLHHALAFIHLSMPTYIAEEYNTHVYDSLEILDDKKYDFVQDI